MEASLFGSSWYAFQQAHDISCSKHLCIPRAADYPEVAVYVWDVVGFIPLETYVIQNAYVCLI